MTQMITGLDQLFLEVNNVEESARFYSDVLGFTLESYEPEVEPPIASLKAGSLKLGLVQQVETMLKRGRGVHVVLGVTDVDQFYEKVSSSGIYVTEPRDEGWGGRFVSFQDPDGYRLFVVTWHEPQHQ
jgi:predicted enzyme related to lactoylglutathione lyase